MGFPDLNAIHEDVEKGLASQEHRLNSAAMAQGFWDFDGKRYMSQFMRDAETPFDYVMRPYRMSGLTRQIVEIITEHLYCPGPGRTWDQKAGNDFLQIVYQDNSIDAMMHRADQLSSMSDVALMQIDADEGIFQDKPITLRLWGAQDFHVWCDPNNRLIPKVVCTVDRYEHGATYKLWTDTHVSLYETPQNENLAGGKVCKFISADAHQYGCLPFETVHNIQPITSYWEVSGGPMIVQGEIRVNDRLSRLDESVNKHLNPVPILENCDENLHPMLEPMRFIRINNAKMRPGPTGGMEDGPKAAVYFLQAVVDIAGAWDDLTKFLTQLLQALRIPAEAVRMEKIEASSGIALIVEQAPLLTRARARHAPFSIYETAISRCILRCAGNHYGRPDLVNDAKHGKLTLGWPQPSVPVPTQDNLDLLLGQVSAGIKSLPMAVSEWYGVDREAAFLLLEQVELDNVELKKRAPTLALQGAGLPPVEDPDDDTDPEDDGSGGTAESDDVDDENALGQAV